jgi:cell division protein FtsA
MGEAERLKRASGCALGRMIAEDEEIEVPGVGGHMPRRVPRRVLSDIIEPRVEEIFAVVRKRIEDTGLLEQLSAGVVLTGGGVLLEGMTEFAEEILGMPVRMGTPVGVRGIAQLVQGPQFATGVGLVQFGSKALQHARERELGEDSIRGGASRRNSSPAILVEDDSPIVVPGRKNGRFWNWLRAAF